MSDYADKIAALADRVVEDAASPEDIREATTVRADDHNAHTQAFLALLNALGNEAQGGSTVQARLEALEQAAGGGVVATEIRYVTTDGSDSNDGLTPLTAKRTVSAAVASLPEQQGEFASENNTWTKGIVHVGPGQFLDESIPWRAWTRIVGAGNGYGGTVIGLADAATGWLFDIDSDGEFPTEFPHFSSIENATLDGRAAAAPSAQGLIRTRNGGFGWHLSHLTLYDTDGIGVQFEGEGATYLGHNLTFRSCRGGAIRIEASGDNFALLLSGVTQVDNCGTDAIVWEFTDDAGPYQAIVIEALKAECVIGEADPGDHEHIVKIVPRPSTVGDRAYLHIGYLKASRNANPNEADSALVYEENSGTGAAAAVSVGRWWAPEYDLGMDLAKQGIQTRNQGTNFLALGGWDKTADWISEDGGLKPARIVDGIEEWVAVGPPGMTDAPDGSLWIDRTPEAAAPLYVRVDGAWHTVDTTPVE